MPRLILFNGPPACGKSTLARRYVDDHPLALNLDVDLLRGLIGRWRDEPRAAGLLARDAALAAARVHLAAGHDVVVPQFLARTAFIEQLERLAPDVAATFHEVVLLDTQENMLRRYAARGADPADPWADDLPAMYDQFVKMITTRPGARIVHVQDGEVDRTYQAALRTLD
jgi:predicted kinase